MSRIDDLLKFSQEILNYNENLKNYFENRRSRILNLSIALMSLSIALASFLKQYTFLTIGCLILMISSLFSVGWFVYTSSPTMSLNGKIPPSIRFLRYNIEDSKNFERNVKKYEKKFSELNKKKMLKDNVNQISILFYIQQRKWYSIRMMIKFLLFGIVFFALFSIGQIIFFILS
jgi:hypothetical protein